MRKSGDWAKRNEIEPFDYFNKMLDKIPDAQELEDFERLLPLKNLENMKFFRYQGVDKLSLTQKANIAAR